MAAEVLLTILASIAALVAVALAYRLAQASRHSLEVAERAVREELRIGRDEAAKASSELRGEVTSQLKGLSDSNEQRLDRLRSTLDTQLAQLQAGNEKKLEEMRKTVDEKLQSTLEKRLGESFKLVSDRLEAVQRGLGEMQNLATGVGDLKRVLTNVKTRGVFGEVQLGAILEQILTPDQYARNVQPKPGSREIVEFALRLPGPDSDPNACVWLPIDAKFPQEDYARLVEAAETGESDAERSASAALARAVRGFAASIRDKYVDPPHTTDFAILFLPTEGLYAEILRQPNLVQSLQQECRVMVAGPTTLAAILTSLRMGFRTLAIEKRASEVWQVLAAVKTEFGKFGEALGRVRKNLDTAARSIDDTAVRTRAMTRRLREVESLPAGESEQVLSLSAESLQAEDEV
ncbi:MAG: DNA recombination protein RmuC [Deltaproteobacteria bacterium]|nr:DNA recombination protein RmuC [Deltaproteobacteria bacterium]